MSCTKSWYELPSLAKRTPSRVTAITPGLARSMKCGITPLLPSLRSVIETGTQAAAFGSVFSTRPPAASASRKPSPVLPAGPGDQCSWPVGACGNIALRLATSWGKPPHASTTPRFALTRTGHPSRSTIAPRTAPSSTISSRTGEESHSGIFRSSADFASRPASALPLVSVMPRQKRIDPRGVKTIAGLVAQIGPRLIRAFHDAPGARQRGAGDPQPAARARGGAAEPRLPFDDQDIEAVMPGGDRGRHAGAARAD